MLHLGGSGSVLIEALLVRHCVRFVNFIIGFNLRMVVAAAAALPVVPFVSVVAVVLPAPEQAHRNNALPHLLRGSGEAKVYMRLHQSSKPGSLSRNLGIKHGALPHEWAASMTGLPKALGTALCTVGVTPLRL